MNWVPAWGEAKSRPPENDSCCDHSMVFLPVRDCEQTQTPEALVNSLLQQVILSQD